MSEKVTIKDIAKRTGTSITSVHRALHGTKGISEELRKKILLEVEKSNYRMDEAASMLRREKFHIVVLLPKNEADERFYYSGLWDGIYRGASEIEKNKVTITYVEAVGGIGYISDALEKLFDETDENLHGLVTLCDDEASLNWVTRFIRRGTKVALIDRGTILQGICCCIKTSSIDMGRLAVNMMHFLMKKDEGVLVLVNGPNQRVSYQEYFQGVKEKMRELNMKQELVNFNGYEAESGKKQLINLLNSWDIKGIITSNARATYWVCEFFDNRTEFELPPIVGTDVFQELQPFFESGILKASIYQSHREHGEKAMKDLYECLINPRMNYEKQTLGTLSLVVKENYKYFL